MQMFDLKGSTVGRCASDEDKAQSVPIYKDLDFGDPLGVDDISKALIISKIQIDCKFLERNNIMDYSLLLGVANGLQGESEKGSRVVVVSENREWTYYLGIIDILQPFNFKKRMEFALKSIWTNSQGLSCVSPTNYSSRFQSFISILLQ